MFNKNTKFELDDYFGYVCLCTLKELERRGLAIRKVI